MNWENIKSKTRAFTQKFLVDHQNSTAEVQNSAIQDHIEKIIAKDIISSLISPGLNSLPNTLMETMMPNISPESVAEAAVQIFGGYDGRFGVSLHSDA